VGHPKGDVLSMQVVLLPLPLCLSAHGRWSLTGTGVRFKWENPIDGFKTVGSSPFRDCDAVIVCFDCTSERSFDNARGLTQEVHPFSQRRLVTRWGGT
jgi:hypothetical protein